jgi:hypothetical protein
MDQTIWRQQPLVHFFKELQSNKWISRPTSLDLASIKQTAQLQSKVSQVLAFNSVIKGLKASCNPAPTQDKPSVETWEYKIWTVHF